MKGNIRNVKYYDSYGLPSYINTRKKDHNVHTGQGMGIVQVSDKFVYAVIQV